MMQTEALLLILLYTVTSIVAAMVSPYPEKNTETLRGAKELLEDGIVKNDPDDIRAAALMPNFDLIINKPHGLHDKNYAKKKLMITHLMLAMRGDVHGGDTPGVISALLEVGADPTVLDHNGYTVLDLCAINGRADICRLFIENGIDPNAISRHKDGKTPLHRAILKNHLDVAQVLVEVGGANVDVELCLKKGFEQGINSDECFHPVYATDSVGIRMLLLEHAKDFALEEVRYHSKIR